MAVWKTAYGICMDSWMLLGLSQNILLPVMHKYALIIQLFRLLFYTQQTAGNVAAS